MAYSAVCADDGEGEMLDVLVQCRRTTKVAAMVDAQAPEKEGDRSVDYVTDKLDSYGAAKIKARSNCFS